MRPKSDLDRHRNPPKEILPRVERTISSISKSGKKSIKPGPHRKQPKPSSIVLYCDVGESGDVWDMGYNGTLHFTDSFCIKNPEEADEYQA